MRSVTGFHYAARRNGVRDGVVDPMDSTDLVGDEDRLQRPRDRLRAVSVALGVAF